MPKFTVKWSRRAEHDLDGVRDYIMEQNPWAAIRFESTLEKMLWPLQEWPNFYPRYMRRPELRLRKIVVGQYLVFYRVLEKQHVVRIARMFHGSMNVEEML